MTSITEHHITVARTARYAAVGAPGAAELWVVCHGYRQLARRFIREFQGIAGAERRIVAPEGLSRFYLDEEGGPHGPEARVGATWMTREDRIAEIDDYVAYLDALAERESEQTDVGVRVSGPGRSRITALGFSQGTATVARWAVQGRTRIDRLILWGGGLPHDLDVAAARERLQGVRVALVYGAEDPFVRAEAVAAQLETLRDLGAERSGQATLRHHAGDDVQMAEAAQQQLQMFADSVAHDLRAPLRSIESFAGLLEKRCGPQLDDGGRDHLQRIRAAAARMGSLLTGLGDLSTATRSELKPATVDLSMLADWVLAELQDAEPDRAADLEITPDLRVQGDERLLKLMLTHLLGNAWKFSRDRDVVRIRVVGEAREGRLHVQVRDAGSGFDMRYARKLFEPFQRLHGPDAGGGHGLGLAAAHRIAARHGGTLSGESVSGEGATFHIDLPTACATEESADAQGHPAG